MFRIKKVVLSAALCILASFSWANTKTSIDTPGFQISAYGGEANTTVNAGTLQGFSETDSLNPNNNSHNQIDFTGGLGIAYRFMVPTFTEIMLHDISVGLDVMYFQTTQKGYTWLFEQPLYNNYYYTLPVNSLRFMADSEWTFHSIGPYLFPFIEGGIGVARNTASYSDAPLLDDTYGLSIDTHTQYQFAYTVGAGVKILLPQNLELSFRYLYASLGNAATSSSASVPLAAPITIPLTTQTWLVGLTYLF